MTRSRRSSEEMYPVVEAFLAGQWTVKAFCAERDLPVAVFTYWLSKYRRGSCGSSAFVEVMPIGTAASEKPMVELAYPNGIRLRFFSAVAPSYLATLLGVDVPRA